ncbi:preprotein translocase subunit SecE [Microbacterium sp. NIBRBAC000506063]|uniref:preprotein translocase subunit SecE n=1 Tax=Microbacterium sp. NIBRBAC000506063 TaxID=2734618 RepID=UPI001BB486FB|nr:preprotein translocase subunit SecE [Microbacterium sp. NIBRBAC000506063]QTV79240.1 preprotein translocase subunit SecE [Microbacterium sp. NIBRBAC000506063]
MTNDPTGGDLVAGGGAVSEKKLGFFGRIALFIRQILAELRKVVTPTRKELAKFTSVVFVFVLIVIGIVYGLDFVFSWLARQVFGIPG